MRKPVARRPVARRPVARKPVALRPVVPGRTTTVTPAAPTTPAATVPSAGTQRTGSTAPRRTAGTRAQRRATESTTLAPIAVAAPAADSSSEPRRPRAAPERKAAAERPAEKPSVVTRRIRDVIETIPPWVNALLLGLGFLAIALLFALLVSRGRQARLKRESSSLARDVGSLQAALLPAVPRDLEGAAVTAAYRPADGPAAGGDFYDVFPLAGGAIGLIVGDMSGHGREALAPTAFMRYTLRAHMESGDDLRVALQRTSEALENASYSGHATVLAAIHRPDKGTFTYAGAGHPAPIVIPGPEPLTAPASPPLGLGLDTGLRQTTVSVGAGTTIGVFTDGLTEAREEDGFVGRSRVAEILAELGDDATAEAVIERVAAAADRVPDDLTLVVLRPTDAPAGPDVTVDELDVRPGESDNGHRFIAASGINGSAGRDASRALEEILARGDSSTVRVVKGGDEPPIVHVEPVRSGAPLA